LKKRPILFLRRDYRFVVKISSTLVLHEHLRQVKVPPHSAFFYILVYSAVAGQKSGCDFAILASVFFAKTADLG